MERGILGLRAHTALLLSSHLQRCAVSVPGFCFYKKTLSRDRGTLNHFQRPGKTHVAMQCVCGRGEKKKHDNKGNRTASTLQQARSKCRRFRALGLAESDTEGTNRLAVLWSVDGDMASTHAFLYLSIPFQYQLADAKSGSLRLSVPPSSLSFF